MKRNDAMTHDAAAGLLPWLVNDSMPDDERQRVLAHAQMCVACRKELAELETLREAVTADATEIDPPPADMRQINRRIDEYMEKRRRIPQAFESLGAFFSDPWKAAVALQAIVIVGLLVALPRQEGTTPRYATLTDDVSLPPGDYLRLVVSTAADSGDLDALLDRFGLSIVDGPSQRGVATVEFLRSVDRERQQEVVRALSEHPMLRFVQPLTVNQP